MVTGKKNPSLVKAAICAVVLSSLSVLAGCITLPSVQDGPDQLADLPTPSASAIPTLIKEKETATFAPTDHIPLSTPSETLIPGSPEAATSLEETFTDNRNNWPTDSTLVTIEAGKYSHKIDCPASNVSPQCGSFIRMPFTFPGSFHLEIDTTVLKSSPGASVLVGFQVRRSDVHYYFASYSISDRYYQMSYISQTGITEIIPETSTDQIKSAIGDTNRLGIELKGRLLVPLINGQEIAPANHGKIREAGLSYLVILIDRGHSAELQFDNLMVQEVN